MTPTVPHMVEWEQVLHNLYLVWPLRLNEMADGQEVVVLSSLFPDFGEVDPLGSDPPDQTSDQAVLQSKAL